MAQLDWDQFVLWVQTRCGDRIHALTGSAFGKGFFTWQYNLVSNKGGSEQSLNLCNICVYQVYFIKCDKRRANKLKGGSARSLVVMFSTSLIKFNVKLDAYFNLSCLHN